MFHHSIIKYLGWEDIAFLNGTGIGLSGNVFLAEANITAGILTGENNKKGVFIGGSAFVGVHLGCRCLSFLKQHLRKHPEEIIFAFAGVPLAHRRFLPLLVFLIRPAVVGVFSNNSCESNRTNMF